METTNKKSKVHQSSRTVKSVFFQQQQGPDGNTELGFLRISDSVCVTSSKQAVGFAFSAAYVPNSTI